MTYPRLLDLFCCQGGAAMGYYRAGFDVVGIDKDQQPRYPFEFVQADALEYVREHGYEYDAIHASPPCQAYSEETPAWARVNHADLIAPTREALMKTGKPYVIENVEAARKLLINPVMVCGSMLGMRIFRHRYFECSGFWMLSPGSCNHAFRPVLVTGTSHYYGENGRRKREFKVKDIREAVGVDWMSSHGLDEHVPPPFTEYIGAHLLKALGHDLQGR